ncbi:MAG: hypothetical protein J0H07_22695, partial [Sphingobacteriales bacterium]|nr:hypothetical protein [Sphingobacteriales bacterium]
MRFIRYKKILGLSVTISLLFTWCLSYGQGVRFTLSAQGVSLDTVLKEIQGRTGYLYLVDKECIRAAGKLSFSVRNATVAEA